MCGYNWVNKSESYIKWKTTNFIIIFQICWIHGSTNIIFLSLWSDCITLLWSFPSILHITKKNLLIELLTGNGVCTYYNVGHCYHFIDGLMGWDQAQTECSENGGYIIEINSAEENRLVAQIVEGLYIYKII